MFFGSRKLQSDALRRCREKRLHRYSLGKLKDVKDKLFHLDPVGFVGTDELTLGVHVGDLLLGHVVLQLWLILAVKRRETTSADGGTSSVGCGSTVGGSRVKSARVSVLLYNISEEGEAEEVVGHVPCVEHEPAVGAPLLGRGQRDLAVLHHLVAAVHLADHAHSLRRVGFLHHLRDRSTALFLSLVGSKHMARTKQLRRRTGNYINNNKKKSDTCTISNCSPSDLD